MTDTNNAERFLKPEDRALRPTVAATEELPKNSRQVIDICFDKYESRALRLGEKKGHIAVENLRASACVKNSRHGAGHRPNWLNLSYHPVILPRYRRLRPSDVFIRAT